MPGSTPKYDCPHVDGIAVAVTLPGGEHTVSCPHCATETVETALEAGVDERCIVIKQATIGPCDHEADARERWPGWADLRGPGVLERP